ncbi:MAG TPA: hypothetical protein VFG76_10005, partial [Candidatus Polarisedimenticolia bacterium]|nr:hypothetical protein [Candidatus Polarisedimenticolia bacterium]
DAPVESRGMIIPSLLGCGTLDEVLAMAPACLDPRRFAPATLVAVDGAEILELSSGGSRLRTARGRLGHRPRIFTSSGLGDHLVEGPRTRLFEAFFLSDGDRATLQDGFHRHSWPGRPHLSVCMRRPEAETVSHTVIEVAAGSAIMTYFPGAPDTEPAPISIGLDVQAPAPARSSQAGFGTFPFEAREAWAG